jgi:hypothetical protein
MATQDRWTVITQTPRTQIDSAGRATRGMLVSFTITSTGDQGEVFVPGDQPEPDLARQMIREYVDRAETVAGLTH